MPISDRVKRLLWARSAGFCGNPNCRNDFFCFFEDGTITSIEELAHVIAQSHDGPRGDATIPSSQLDEYSNIILLCPNCHTKIDKAPQIFPVELLREWKANQEELSRAPFIEQTYNNRAELSATVRDLLRQNKRAFNQYGPFSDFASDPLSDAAKVWIRYVHSTIIPNNRKLSRIFSVHNHLLTEDEREVVDRFIIHQESFEYNHVSGDKVSSAPLFPIELNTILLGE